MANGDYDVYNALIAQVFEQFAAAIGLSSETGFGWTNPSEYTTGNATLIFVSRDEMVQLKHKRQLIYISDWCDCSPFLRHYC